jgi:error-prone DNA polymerase
MVQIAGNVICRQRPGTAKGFVFISLEDETGVANAIVTPDLFERFRLVITEEPFLVIEGEVQNTDGVVLVKARKIQAAARGAGRRERLARFPLGPPPPAFLSSRSSARSG